MARSTAVRSFGLAAAAGAGVAGAGAWYVAQPERQSNSRTAKRDARRMKDLLGASGSYRAHPGIEVTELRRRTQRTARQQGQVTARVSLLPVRAVVGVLFVVVVLLWSGFPTVLA